MSLFLSAAHLGANLPGVEDDAAERISTWSVELNRWSRTQRLVGWRTADDLLREGVADAWAAVPLIAGTEGPVIDLGSGCGLPGLVLAAALPKRRLYLVEARRKRVSFLRAAVRAMKLAEVTVHHGRTEELRESDELPEGAVVVAKAFAQPPVVLAQAALLAARGCLLSIAPPAPESPGWTVVRTTAGRPADRRLHVLYET